MPFTRSGQYTGVGSILWCVLGLGMGSIRGLAVILGLGSVMQTHYVCGVIKTHLMYATGARVSPTILFHSSVRRVVMN